MNLALEKGRTRPVRTRKPRARKDRAEPERALRCRACGHRATAESARITVAGASVHTRTNPAGVTFTFGCFADATCLIDGVPTFQDSWFPDCAWRYAHCAGCASHLGWRFDGAASFFALILDRLLES